MSVEKPLRIGITAAASLTASATLNQALSAEVLVAATLLATAQKTTPNYATISSGAFPFSTLFGVFGETGAFDEDYWPVVISGGILSNILVKYVDIEVAGSHTQGSSPTDPAIDKDPVFTYVLGRLDRVTYSNGNYRTFTYTGSGLQSSDYINPSETVRKSFSYDIFGRLESVSEAGL